MRGTEGTADTDLRRQSQAKRDSGHAVLTLCANGDACARVMIMCHVTTIGA